MKAALPRHAHANRVAVSFVIPVVHASQRLS
jgi:hypothetical protein